MVIFQYSEDPKTGHPNTGKIKKPDEFVRFSNALAAILFLLA
jgi:hypothetical protein